MIIFPYPKPTKCYGDTVIRRQDRERMNFVYTLNKTKQHHTKGQGS